MKVISDKYITARKVHRCCLCGGIITNGEEYHKKVLDDGGLRDYVTHTYCDDLVEKLKMYQTCGYDEGLTDIDFECCLDDYITEHYDENEAAFIKRYDVEKRAMYVSGDLENEKAIIKNT